MVDDRGTRSAGEDVVDVVDGIKTPSVDADRMPLCSPLSHGNMAHQYPPLSVVFHS